MPTYKWRSTEWLPGVWVFKITLIGEAYIRLVEAEKAGVGKGVNLMRFERNQ